MNEHHIEAQLKKAVEASGGLCWKLVCPGTTGVPDRLCLMGSQVVFVEVPGGFEAKTVDVGRSDGVRTEIVKGLSAGARYASTNSFVIKAEIGKASAEHSH